MPLLRTSGPIAEVKGRRLAEISNFLLPAAMAYAQVQTRESDDTSGRGIEKGALYTVQERMATFQVPYCHWPFDSGSCTTLKAS